MTSHALWPAWPADASRIEDVDDPEDVVGQTAAERKDDAFCSMDDASLEGVEDGDGGHALLLRRFLGTEGVQERVMVVINKYGICKCVYRVLKAFCSSLCRADFRI